MHMRHVSPKDFGRNGDSVAAQQHNFPKAVIQCWLIGRKTGSSTTFEALLANTPIVVVRN